MTNQGWILLHRKILENPIIKKPQYFTVWVTLLLKANHEDIKMIWNGKNITIKSGQFVTGRKQLSLETGIPETSIERILTYLENEHQIGQQKTTKYRLITIQNWEVYQKRTANRTTGGQQTDTNNNDNNDKEEYTEASSVASQPFIWKEYHKQMASDKRKHIRIIAYYFNKIKKSFSSKEEIEQAIARHCRYAVKVGKFERNKIIEAMNECYDEYTNVNESDKIGWTLETVWKHLTK